MHVVYSEQDVVIHLLDFIKVKQIGDRVVSASVAGAALLDGCRIVSIGRFIFCQINLCHSSC